ncbi:class I SAM-dependent methyltransferase [Nakamurella sp.]|uniref:class I SAM-dependent methyltransferase n=1 Tax=Nakamurella sp. TaxID=1869182 RepID=UPI0037838512
MLTSTNLGRRSFALWYPALMGRIDRNGQAALRRDQLATARGRVLEIGAGSGLSVPHYPSGIDELVLVEPNHAFHPSLRIAADSLPFPTSVVDVDAHELPFTDSSFDTVTASLVFCSVDDPERMLAEIHRVLRPGGRFLFHEHVRGGRVRGIVQDLCTPLQRRLADGCRPNRDFEASLATSALQVVSITHRRMPTLIPTLVPLVVGTAERGPVERIDRADDPGLRSALAEPAR